MPSHAAARKAAKQLKRGYSKSPSRFYIIEPEDTLTSARVITAAYDPLVQAVRPYVEQFDDSRLAKAFRDVVGEVATREEMKR